MIKKGKGKKMRLSWKKFAAIALGSLMAISTAACGMKADDVESNTTSSAAEQAITINIESEPPTLSSLDCTDLVSMNVLRHTMEGLTVLDDKNSVQPGIAERWDVSKDGLTYTFHLRDAKWSNGDSVTANDFEFAWKKILDPDYGAMYAYLLYDIKGAADYNQGNAKAEDVAVKAVDEKTLEVTLRQETAYFDFLCAQASFLPINEKYYTSLESGDGNTYASEPDKLLYDGPFTIQEWNHESDMILVKNTDYYNADSIQLESARLMMVSNGSTAYDMYKTGDLDMVSFSTGDQIEKAKQDGNEVLTKSNGAIYYLEFNTENEVLKNANIRRALSYALNRQALVEQALKDASTPALLFTSPDITLNGKSYADQVNSPIKDNDVEGAKKALEEGLKELGLKELPTLSITIDDKDGNKTQAAVYQEFWKQNLGVTVEVNSMPYKSMLSKVQSGDFEMSITAWGPDYNDPSTFLEVFRSNTGMNDTKYASETYDKLLDEAKVEMDPDKRAAAYAKAEEQLLSDMPFAPLRFYNTSYLVSDKVEGLYRTSFQDINFIHASVK